LPAGVPTGQAGPRLIAFSGLLLSCFRQSKRRAALFLSMVLHQPACPGWMVCLQKLAAEAVQPAYDELVRLLPQQAVLYIDESPTKEGKTKSWIWTFVAAMRQMADLTGTPIEHMSGDAGVHHFRRLYTGTLILNIGINAQHGAHLIADSMPITSGGVALR
jgi:hypothetical protein